MLNAEGDIIKIVDSTGGVVVEYAYDAWGNPMGVSGSMASTLGADNPFRYRGYYYDEETELYYINQRYYNPEWSRFINADTYGGSTGKLFSHNVFTYCSNNPVMKSDPSGKGSVHNDYMQAYWENRLKWEVVNRLSDKQKKL